MNLNDKPVLSEAEMTESVAFNGTDTSSQTQSDYKVNIMALHKIQRCHSKQFSDLNDSVSMQDFNSQNHKHPSVYKCFKCYGNAIFKSMEGYIKCRQCQGTEFISDNHPLVTIFEQILTKLVPELANKSQKTKKGKINRRQTIQLQYGCKDAIKEQSFSIQQELLPTCRGCNQQCDALYHKCDKCPDFCVCLKCYNQNNYYHIHSLKGQNFLNDESLKLNNLKKISQQIQAEQTSFYVQQTVKTCHNCKNQIQECYVLCTSCQLNSKQFILCDKCYQLNQFNHDPDHQLTIKTSGFSQIGLQFKKSQKQQNYRYLFSSHPVNIKSISKRQQQNKKQEQYFLDKSNSNSEINKKLENSVQSDLNLFQNSIQNSHPKVMQQERKNNLVLQTLLKPNVSESLQFSNSSQSLIKSQSLQNESVREQKSVNNEKEQEKRQSIVDVYQIKYSLPKQVKTNPEEQFVFNDYICDHCQISPIRNKKFHCKICKDYDLCQQCYIQQQYEHQHNDFQVNEGKVKTQIIQQIYKKAKLQKLTNSCQFSPQSKKEKTSITININIE